MELKNLKGNTYILDTYNRVGIYLINDNEAVIIDTGLDDESGQKIIDICNEQKWTIKMILLTHSHPDHIGGNYLISQTLNVPFYAYKTERVMAENPILISSMAYGGYPHKYLANKYLTPKSVMVGELTNEILPDGIEFFPLPGHNSDMVGFKTKDDVYFLADAIAGEDIITKYKLQFMYDVKEYFKTLDYISELKEGVFVPSHGKISTDIKKIVDINRNTINEVIDKIKEVCQNEISFENILKEITLFYHMRLEFVQYSFMSVTLKCYLAYLLNDGVIKCEFKDNQLLWKTS